MEFLQIFCIATAVVRPNKNSGSCLPKQLHLFDEVLDQMKQLLDETTVILVELFDETSSVVWSI